MPAWSGIEDPSPIADKVWFSRHKEGDPWKPLRRADCIQLNKQAKGEVLIECGRATADPENNLIAYNFYNAPKRELCSAIWFLTEYKSDKEIKLTPISSEKDETVIENFYQRAVQGSSSLGDIRKVLKEETGLLDDDKYKVIIVKVGNSLRLRKKPKAVLSLEAHIDLQRGYGEYEVEGEQEEMALGPVHHLSFVIHGIGEAMWKRNGVHIMGMVQSVEMMRNTINKKLFDSWKQECQRCSRQNRPIPEAPNRIELIPIEWYDKIHSKSSTLKNQLLSATLQTVPKLRAIANDVVFDVLMYLTPEFCEQVLNCVTEQIVNQYTLFKAIHTDFAQGGSVSLIGHSLGSVITWDMLSILGDKMKETSSVSGTGTADDPIEIVLDDQDQMSFRLPQPTNEQVSGAYKSYAGVSDVQQGGGTWGPSLEKEVKQTLPFVPKFTFFVGSPLGLFLTLRGARPLFDEMRQSNASERKTSVDDDKEAVMDEDKEADVDKDEEATVDKDKEAAADDDLEPVSPFSLPSGSIYNIFHPSDPVAYRIEPLLMPQDFDDSLLPAPEFLVLDGQGVRFHVKAKEISDTLFKSISGMFRVQDKARQKGETTWRFKLGGSSERVDFQLQPGRLDNEYISAISAHSSYWVNSDLMDFLIQCARSN